MEDGLVQFTDDYDDDITLTCLNPCCNGRWSRTEVHKFVLPAEKEVLILVVMEDGLVQNHHLLN